jgi:FKBP-type peptidyl-prolyl cis-trans isomerase SlyD
MKVDTRKYVEIDYRLTLDDGEVVDQSEPGTPLGFICGTHQIIPGLEQALLGMEAGQNKQVTVEPKDGYGMPKTELHREIPRENFPADLDLKPGMGFEATGPHGPVTFRVLSTTDDVVVADFNHPLAGQRLYFDVTVSGVREPRAEELAQLQADSDCSPAACAGCSSSCG